MKAAIVLILSSLCLLSCGHKEEEKPSGVLTTTQEQTLQKAKQVDDIAKKADAERLKELDQAEGKTADEK